MAALTPSVPTRAAGVDFADGGVSWSTASAGGDTFPPSADNYLFIKSTNTGSVTVYVNAGANTGPLGVSYQSTALAPAVGATTGRRVYGPFPATPFIDPSDGQIHISYSSATNVQVAVLNFSAT